MYGRQLGEIYRELGCSKQNLSYWKNHPYSTQPKRSLFKVIHNAARIFSLSEAQSEALANTAGISLYGEKNGFANYLLQNYNGRLKTLYDSALISERMFRYYKKNTPTKQALLAVAVSLGLQPEEMDGLLHTCGYCLSKSMVTDLVVVRVVTSGSGKENRNMLLQEINGVLYTMGLPLLMTRQIC
jgi:hypothetical protein